MTKIYMVVDVHEETHVPTVPAVFKKREDATKFLERYCYAQPDSYEIDLAFECTHIVEADVSESYESYSYEE